MARIAVIGAGLAGLVIAQALGKDHDVIVFEKSRSVGGRMATFDLRANSGGSLDEATSLTGLLIDEGPVGCRAVRR